MYQSFAIRNFRCFNDMTIEGFERVNLITGKNNVGKTALMEALWLYHGYQNPVLGVTVDKLRGLETFRKDDFLRNLFSGFDTGKSIELSSVDAGGKEQALRISIGQKTVSSIPVGNGKNGDAKTDLSASEAISQESTEPMDPEAVYEVTDASGTRVSAKAFFEGTNISVKQLARERKSSGIFLAARTPHNSAVIAERLSNLAVEKMEEVIVNALQIVEPRLVSLRVQYRGGLPLIYGDIGLKRLIPFPLMGDGMSRLLGVALAMTDARDGILLIDEIENGIHHSVMPKLWKTVSALAQDNNVQIFATTHSIECVLAAYEAFNEQEPYDFSLYRLDQKKGEIRAVQYDKETLKAAVETNLEVR
jgi:AAA15 family ATPase/GTPase